MVLTLHCKVLCDDCCWGKQTTLEQKKEININVKQKTQNKQNFLNVYILFDISIYSFDILIPPNLLFF